MYPSWSQNSDMSIVLFVVEPSRRQLPLCCHAGRGRCQEGEEEEAGEEGELGRSQTGTGNGWTQNPHWRIIRKARDRPWNGRYTVTHYRDEHRIIHKARDSEMVGTLWHITGTNTESPLRSFRSYTQMLGIDPGWNGETGRHLDKLEHEELNIVCTWCTQLHRFCQKNLSNLPTHHSHICILDRLLPLFLGIWYCFDWQCFSDKTDDLKMSLIEQGLF